MGQPFSARAALLLRQRGKLLASVCGAQAYLRIGGAVAPRERRFRHPLPSVAVSGILLPRFRSAAGVVQTPCFAGNISRV